MSTPRTEDASTQPGQRPPEPALRSSPRVPSREATREHANPYKGLQGAERIAQAARNSVEGLRAAYRNESAFRQETWLAVVLIPLALWLGQTATERVLLAGSVLLVLIVELLNSGIEAAIDRVSYELHDLSKRAKDFASAAVLLSLLLCGGTWLAILGARLGWWA